LQYANILVEKNIIFSEGARPKKVTEGPGWLRHATDVTDWVQQECVSTAGWHTVENIAEDADGYFFQSWPIHNENHVLSAVTQTKRVKRPWLWTSTRTSWTWPWPYVQRCQTQFYIGQTVT